MKKTLLLVLIASLTVAGCGRMRDSRLNPLNWFGRSSAGPETLTPEGGYAAGDNRALVAQVLSMTVEQTPTGAIVTATGLPPTQGWWDAELVAENGGQPDEKGVLSYRFVVAAPRGTEPVSTQASREVTAAAAISAVKLAGVREIVVLGAGNSRVSRR